jgi:3-carboxy-cis,cis-muconate cycloisomerase
MSFSAFDHPILSALLGDAEIASYFSVEAEIFAMLAFEGALARAQAFAGLIANDAAQNIAARCSDFTPDLAELARSFARDGVVVPALVKALRAHIGEPDGAQAHRGATSQDVIDSALVLRLKPVLSIYEKRIDAILAILDRLSRDHGATPLMGRTRMQRAMPILAADKLRQWRDPLARDLIRLDELRPRLLVVQFGGAVGNRAGLDGKADAIVAQLARLLDLGAAPCWHVERDRLAELCNWLSLLSGSLGKIGADIALMAQNEIGEIKLAEGGASSAMPHKSNPVKAESLVALARFNAAMLGAQHQALVHENERSGAAWTLEWMALPQMVAAAGAALNLTASLCDGLRFIERSQTKI